MFFSCQRKEETTAPRLADMLEKREASYWEMSSDTLRNMNVFSQSHVDGSSLETWSKCFISGKVYNSPCFNTFHVQANKRDVPSLEVYNITWFNINSIVPAARFVSHISTQDVETEREKKKKKQHETKALHTSEKSTHPSASQCEWREVKAMFSFQHRWCCWWDLTWNVQAGLAGMAMFVYLELVFAGSTTKFLMFELLLLLQYIKLHTTSTLLLDDWPWVLLAVLTKSDEQLSFSLRSVSAMSGWNNQTRTLLNGSGSLLAKDSSHFSNQLYMIHL